MTSIADTSVKIQTTSEPNPSTPCWFGEVVVISGFLHLSGIGCHLVQHSRAFWQSRQRTLPNGTAQGTHSHHALSHRAPPPTDACPASARRTIWHRGGAGRCG